MDDVAIIGAGPAGIACAIQLSRYGFRPLLFEKDIPGGLLKNANRVENYIGFPGGIPGISLIGKMTKQLESAHIPVINEKVINIDYHNDIFQIQTGKNQYTSHILVIASGTSPIRFPVSGIMNSKFQIPNSKLGQVHRNHILYEIHPIRDIQNARIAIIGAGDAAFDYALQMSLYNKVLIFNRSDRLKCLPLLWHRAKGIEQISYHENYSLMKTAFDPVLTCLKLFFQTPEEIRSYLADYIIFAIGRRPELSYTNPGLISLFEQLQQKRKLYFAGDISNDMFRQASIAAGDGIRTAMQIYFNESN